jgi:hypothetical protein
MTLGLLIATYHAACTFIEFFLKERNRKKKESVVDIEKYKKKLKPKQDKSIQVHPLSWVTIGV